MKDTPITLEGVSVDDDGWKIDNDSSAIIPRTVRLFEFRDADVQNRKLVFRMKMRTEPTAAKTNPISARPRLVCRALRKRPATELLNRPRTHSSRRRPAL